MGMAAIGAMGTMGVCAPGPFASSSLYARVGGLISLPELHAVCVHK